MAKAAEEPFDLAYSTETLRKGPPGTRVTAGLAIWKYALTLSKEPTAKENRTVVGQAGVQAAVACVAQGAPLEQSTAAGLLACLAECEELREYVVQARAVLPLCALCERGTYAGKSGAAATLRWVAETPDTRKALVRDLGGGDKLRPLVLCIADASNPADSRRDCAAVLRQLTAGPSAEAEAFRVELGQPGSLGLPALVGLLGEEGVEVVAMEAAAGALANAAQVEENKDIIVAAGGVPPLVNAVGHEPLGLLGRGYAAGCLWHLSATHRPMAPPDPPTVDLRPRGYGTVVSEKLAEEPPPSEAQRRLRLRSTQPVSASQASSLSSMDSRVQLIMDAGGVKPLVGLLSPPTGDEAAAGGKKKKGKKKKGEQLPPGMDQAQRNAAGCLRHVALQPNGRAEIAAAGGIQHMVKLLEAQRPQTRHNANSVLGSLSGAGEFARPMTSSGAPPRFVNTLPTGMPRPEGDAGLDMSRPTTSSTVKASLMGTL